MKFSIDRKYFYEKLNIVSRAISMFSPLPALSGILIQVQNDSIVLTGSDSNISIRSIIHAGEMNNLQIEETGSIIMESKYLLEIVRKMDSTIIEFDVVDFTLIRISNQNGQYNINGVQANEYPNIDFSQPEQCFELKGKDLKAIVSQTSFACSDKDARPVLNGVNFRADGNSLYCSGTDTYRLAHKTIELSKSQYFNITIPSKSLQEVVKSLKEDDEVIQIYVDAKKAQFVFDQNIIQTRLLSGTFPDVERIIPTEAMSTLDIDTFEISHAIDRTNFIRNDRMHLVKLECSIDEMRMKTSSDEIGNSDEVLTSAKYQGPELTVSCNGSYMLDAIKALGGEKVHFDFSGVMKPIKITNPDDDSTLMVIVPVRSYD